MKTFDATLNGKALEVAGAILFGSEGNQKLLAGYNQVNEAMASAYSIGAAEATKADAAKLEELRRIERDAGFNDGLEAGRASMRAGVPLEDVKETAADAWADRIPTYAKVLADRDRIAAGAAGALQAEYEQQHDSGDETPSYSW